MTRHAPFAAGVIRALRTRGDFQRMQLVTVLPAPWRSESGPARIVAVDVAPGYALVTLLEGSTRPGVEIVVPYSRLRLAEKEKPHGR